MPTPKLMSALSLSRRLHATLMIEASLHFALAAWISNSMQGDGWMMGCTRSMVWMGRVRFDEHRRALQSTGISTCQEGHTSRIGVSIHSHIRQNPQQCRQLSVSGYSMHCAVRYVDNRSNHDLNRLHRRYCSIPRSTDMAGGPESPLLHHQASTR